MPDNLYNSIPLSEDDVVINLRFNAIFSARRPLLSFREEWIMKQIKKRFENYTFNNSIRLNAVEALNDQMLLFDFKQIDPDIALEEIVENINANLEETFETFNVEITVDFWETVKIFSIGNEDDALEQANEYLKRIKRENDTTENSSP
jgi:hypothetical protein